MFSHRIYYLYNFWYFVIIGINSFSTWICLPRNWPGGTVIGGSVGGAVASNHYSYSRSFGNWPEFNRTLFASCVNNSSYTYIVISGVNVHADIPQPPVDLVAGVVVSKSSEKSKNPK